MNFSSFNFEIKKAGIISEKFLARYCNDFITASQYIKFLPYRRNANKNDLRTVFTDGYGTCSTKHALLKLLCIENGIAEVSLKLGIFKMNGNNTPVVARVLNKYKLEYIPEAHNYLAVHNEIIDCTKATSGKDDFIHDLFDEIEITPWQITDYKVIYHKNFLEDWLLMQPDLNFSLEDTWKIREECIAALSGI